MLLFNVSLFNNEIIIDGCGRGRIITVREYVEDVNDRGASARNGGVANMTGRKVYVGNLSFDVTWQALKDYFRQAGSVVHADIAVDVSGKSRGFGFVEFERPDDVATAIRELNDTVLLDRRIFVREDREEGKGDRSTTFDVPVNRSAPAIRYTDHSTGAVGRKVYVGNLSWDVTWQALKDYFRQAGSVLHADVALEPTGRSRGFGFVEFEQVSEAETAIRELNDTMLLGRKIFVREDREEGKGERSFAAGERNAWNADSFEDASTSAPSVRHTDRHHDSSASTGIVGRKVYVGNLSWDVTWQALKDYFRQAGSVLHADVALEATGRSRGFGFVEFEQVSEAETAIRELNDTMLLGRKIFVREDREEVKEGKGITSNVDSAMTVEDSLAMGLRAAR